MKREVPLVLTFVMTLLRFGFEMLNPMLTYEISEGVRLFSRISFSVTFMYCMGLFMGLINLTRVHGNTIRRRREHWIYSVWLLIVMYGYAILGLFFGGMESKPFTWIYDAVIVPLDSTMFSLLAFFIASAAYRAFRIRNVESVIMMVVAFIVMLGNVSLGEVLWSSEAFLGGFKGLKDWFLATPNAASQRAIGIGVFLGSYAAILRVALGLEKRYLGGID
ncbi:MAG TPA: hypothetical protein GX729_01855 [Firmicutes bacterium]|nr:hypothetical protein [Bacillota bacterium]